jgi:hypothetical protein
VEATQFICPHVHGPLLTTLPSVLAQTGPKKQMHLYELEHEYVVVVSVLMDKSAVKKHALGRLSDVIITGFLI